MPWCKPLPYLRIGIPSTWFFGYQFEKSTPPQRDLVLCIVPPIAIAIDLGSLWHRLTCSICYPRNWRLNWWVH